MSSQKPYQLPLWQTSPDLLPFEQPASEAPSAPEPAPSQSPAAKSTLDRMYQALDFVPYPYQKRLALEDWPDLLKIPTGLGKTAAVFLAWLYKLLTVPQTPRRLVWCLPMRVLVEQTVSCLNNWIDRLDRNGLLEHRPKVYVLMGGQLDQDWDRFPEDWAVLVGTQDQLLSRALNRGYAMSRFRWPLDFALLHNDCLWVFDEVQLMGAGLASSAQLEAFRNRFGVFLPCRSLWCSATVLSSWLHTVDFQAHNLKVHELGEEDRDFPEVRRRLEAGKNLNAIQEKQVVKTVLDHHRPDTLTLVIRNRVEDAVKLFKALQQKQGKKKKKASLPELVLLHSRFRPHERQEQMQKLRTKPGEAGRIVISTQVVEAGVDISAALLFTDIAPWPSLVQRFGRCNRQGEYAEAQVFWLGRKLTTKNAPPYELEELESAKARLETLSAVGLAQLPESDAPRKQSAVLRSPDLLDLFDTTPDLAGADIDIARFVREGTDSDLQVFWRDWGAGKVGRPPKDLSQPRAEELCRVPVGVLTKDWLARKKAAWIWDALQGQWTALSRPRPGMVVLLSAKGGGYTPDCGWDSASTSPVSEVPPKDRTLKAQAPEQMDQDLWAQWQTLLAHAEQAEHELDQLVKALNLPHLAGFADCLPALRKAARLHDCGKAHPVHQDACENADRAILWAKAPKMSAYQRCGFRHELASALALLATGHDDLTAYLVAAHHGKIRLSLRALPGEQGPQNEPERRFARGIWDGEFLPASELLPEVRLSLACMELGLSAEGASWAERTAQVLETWGPFKLTFLETLVRLADWRASAALEENHA